MRGWAPGSLWAPVLLLLAGHGVLSVVPALREIRHDFASYYVPARLVWEGRDLSRLYERDWFQAEVRKVGIDRLASFLPHPPPNALLLLPMAGLPPLAAKAAWTIVLLVALAASYLILRRLLDVPPALLALVVLLPTASLRNALLYGQPYPLLLLLLCLSLLAMVRGRPASAGLLLAPVLVLKLYGAVFLLRFLSTRRWRAAAGLLLGSVLFVLASLAVLGRPLHAVYAREVLPASLSGEVQDPYSPTWGSPASLAHRLFQREADLNPDPVADWPAAARVLSRGTSVVLLLLAVLAGGRDLDPRREWAVLTLGSLAAAPLTSSYHFVLLVLPVAVLVAGPAGRGPLLAAVLALLAFAASPLPHYFARFASGWGNLLAYPRLIAVLALFALSLRGLVTMRRSAVAAAAGLVAGLTALPRPPEEPWERVAEARGFLQAEPVACEGGLAWVTIAAERLVVRGPDGRLRHGSGDTVAPRCVEGRLVTREGPDPRDQVGSLQARHARLSPDGQWVVFESWQGRSWDLRALHRQSGRVVPVTRDSANEVEPSWMPSGREIVFASDRRRGLGSTALYRVPFER